MRKRRGCATTALWNLVTRTRARPATTWFMALRTDRYVDTSVSIAFLDRSDSHHPLFRRRFSDPPPLVTSALVIAEGHGWFLRRYDRHRANQFLGFVDELPRLEIWRFDSVELPKVSRVVRKFA